MASREPVLTTAAVQSFVGAVIALLVAFGLKLSADQTAAVLGFTAVAAPIVFGFVARRAVTPLSDPKDAAGNALTPL